MEPGSPDRANLGAVGGDEAIAMTGYVGKYGRKDSTKERTILLRRLMHRGRIVTNHQWFICGPWSAGLRKWDVVRVVSTGTSIYRRGYRKGKNGESYQLNQPVESSKIEPPDEIVVHIDAIDRTMVTSGMFDHGLVFDVLRGRGGLYTNFQRQLLQNIPALMGDDVAQIMQYMTDRVSQYGSLSVTKRALHKLYKRG